MVTKMALYLSRTNSDLNSATKVLLFFDMSKYSSLFVKRL